MLVKFKMVDNDVNKLQMLRKNWKKMKIAVLGCGILGPKIAGMLLGFIILILLVELTSN